MSSYSGRTLLLWIIVSFKVTWTSLQIAEESIHHSPFNANTYRIVINRTRFPFPRRPRPAALSKNSRIELLECHFAWPSRWILGDDPWRRSGVTSESVSRPKKIPAIERSECVAIVSQGSSRLQEGREVWDFLLWKSWEGRSQLLEHPVSPQ